MNKAFELLYQANQSIDQGRLVTAEKRLKEAEKTVSEDLELMIIAFQLGALHWGSTGDGEHARECFLRTVKLWQTHSATSSQYLPSAPYANFYANACENLMILSLSFEEYFQWAGRLEAVAPQEAILQQQHPKIRQLKEAGHPWSEVMMWMSGSYIHPDPTQDPGRYGSAACILQLMLKNRKTLRLSRQEWRMAVIRYGAVAMLAAGKCDKVMREKTGRTAPLEYRFIVENAFPLVEEYVNANPNDPQAQKTLEGLRGGPAFSDKIAQGETPAREMDLVTKRSILIAPYLWTFLAGVAFYYLHNPWKLVLGIPLVILSIITTMVAIQSPGRRNRSEPDRTVGWRFSNELRRAIQKQGLIGLRFQCLGAKPALDGSLEIEFESLTPVSDEKRRDAHLALRCIVGLTFPEVVSCVPNCQIEVDPDLNYTVRIGDGVPMPSYFVKTPVERVGPLQVTSEESEERYWVYVKPLLIQLAMPGKGAGVLAEIAPAFDHWKSLSVDMK